MAYSVVWLLPFNLLPFNGQHSLLVTTLDICLERPTTSLPFNYLSKLRLLSLTMKFFEVFEVILLLTLPYLLCFISLWHAPIIVSIIIYILLFFSISSVCLRAIQLLSIYHQLLLQVLTSFCTLIGNAHQGGGYYNSSMQDIWPVCCKSISLNCLF